MSESGRRSFISKNISLPHPELLQGFIHRGAVLWLDVVCTQDPSQQVLSCECYTRLSGLHWRAPHTGMGAGRQRAVLSQDHEKSEVRLHRDFCFLLRAFWLHSRSQSLHGIKHGETATALTKINDKQLLLSRIEDSEEIRKEIGADQSLLHRNLAWNFK